MSSFMSDDPSAIRAVFVTESSAKSPSGVPGLPPFRSDGWTTPIEGRFAVKVQGGRYVLCFAERDEGIAVSSDFVFALGSILGLFEPMDCGRDTDGTRLMFTRATLLEETFGPDWGRYARAVTRVDAREGVPVMVTGLPA